ncbi:lipopolysaccharide biosynthesis protein [Taibaiella helva]|uniref:lipopolysaccharide biosynthesis protein n=1 Tax=Taibaiella helva TaxID=2301235 RepID=UPI001E65C72B|nr:polysaccharide biosynthesis C-terminal domain-containing protein [Taibaiella helva]
MILRIFGLLILMVFYFGFISFSGFFILTIFSHLLSAILLLWYSFRAGGFGFSNNWRTFTVAEYKELVHFSWYHLLMGLSLFVIGFLDSLMLAALSEDGVSSVPVYTIAVFITTLMTIPYRAIINAVFPVLNRAYIDQKKDEFYDLFARSSVNIQIVAIAMVIIIGFNLPNAVRVLPKGYESVLPVVWILMLGRMADMATGMNNEVISISSLYKFNFRISVFLIALLVLLNRILIPIYSIYGAAWGTTIAMILFNTAKTIYLRRKMNLWPFSIRSLAILFAGGLAGAVAYCMPYIGNPVADAIIRSLAILIVYILLLLRLRPSPDLNNFVTKIFNRIKTH